MLLRRLQNQKFLRTAKRFSVINLQNLEADKAWYHPEYDDYDTHNDNIRLYSREEPDELDFEEVWDGAWNNMMMPDFFYFAFFCGVIYTFEPEVLHPK